MTQPKPKYAFADETIPSVADILERVRVSDDPLLIKVRPQVLTSLNRLQRFACLDPAATPFVPPVLRAILADLTPTLTGLSKKSLQNDRSNIRLLLHHFGLGGLRRYQVKLTSKYAKFYGEIDDCHQRAGISRLFKFAQVQQVPLNLVDDAFANQFRRALRQEGVMRDPETSWRTAIRRWNDLAARFPTWNLQPLTLPVVKRGWAYPWEAFPASLIDEIEEYFAARSEEGDLFDPEAPEVILAPRTIETQNEWLRMIASAAVKAGMAQSSLTSLGDLV